MIVFTHNIVFAWCLQNLAVESNITFTVQPLARMGDRVGIVRTKNQAWPGEPIKSRIGRLRLALQELEAVDRKGDIDRYEVDAKVLAGDLREAWERAVEELLFRGVVMRFQRDVSARKIRDVVVTADLTREVYEGMTETSPFHHEASLAKPIPTPTIDELKSFFGRLESFCGALRAKPAAAKKAVAEASDSAA